MKDKDKIRKNQKPDDDKIAVGKSVFQVNREMHEQKLAELEKQQEELARQARERERKKREAYERRILEEKKELMRLKQGLIEESETIHEEHEEAPKLSIWKKIINFFYHNKWWLGIGAVLVVAAVFLVHNLLTKPHPDLTVIVLGEHDCIGYAEGLDDYVASFADDFNGNGKTEVEVYYIPYSSDEYRNYAEGVDGKLMSQFQTAESLIVISGSDINDILNPEEIFMNLEELYPGNKNVKEYRFNLKDTDFAERIGIGNDLSDDELFIAIRRPKNLMYAKYKEIEETYEKDFPVFDKMINDLTK